MARDGRVGRRGAASGIMREQPRGLDDPHGIPAIIFMPGHDRGRAALRRCASDAAELDDGISLEHVTVTNPSFNIGAQGEWRGKGAGSGRIVGALTSTDVQN